MILEQIAMKTKERIRAAKEQLSLAEMRARALAMDCRVLLMDEPFSALDGDTKHKLWDEVDHIRRETKKTVLMVTHSVKEAVFLADRIIELYPEHGGIKAEYQIEIKGNRKDHEQEMQEMIERITGN